MPTNRHVHSPRSIGHGIALSRVRMAAGLLLLALPACDMAAGESASEPGMIMADEAGFEVIAALYPDATPRSPSPRNPP